MNLSPSFTPSFEAVAKLARELWERQGRPLGQERAHWFEAERRIWAAASGDNAEALELSTPYQTRRRRGAGSGSY